MRRRKFGGVLGGPRGRNSGMGCGRGNRCLHTGKEDQTLKHDKAGKENSVEKDASELEIHLQGEFQITAYNILQ